MEIRVQRRNRFFRYIDTISFYLFKLGHYIQYSAIILMIKNLRSLSKKYLTEITLYLNVKKTIDNNDIKMENFGNNLSSDEKKINYDIKFNYVDSHNVKNTYRILYGKANKLIFNGENRYSFIGSKNDEIIYSYSNYVSQNYIEDFYIKMPSNDFYICRPNRIKTNFYNLSDDYLTVQTQGDSFFSKLIRNLFYKKSKVLLENSNIITFCKEINKTIPDYLVLDSNSNKNKRNLFSSIFTSSNGFHNHINYNVSSPGSSLKYYYPNDLIKGSKQILPLIVKKMDKNIESIDEFNFEVNKMIDTSLNKAMLNYILVNVTLFCISTYSMKLIYDGFTWLSNFFNSSKRKFLICINCNKNLNNIICTKCLNYFDYCSDCLNEILNNKETYLANKEIFICDKYSFGIFKCKNILSKGYIVE